jgi:hypothetical protein
VVTQNITVDRSIEMLEDWFDPEGQGDQSDLLEELHRQDSQSDAFLTGRRRPGLTSTGYLSTPSYRAGVADYFPMGLKSEAA